MLGILMNAALDKGCMRTSPAGKGMIFIKIGIRGICF